MQKLPKILNIIGNIWLKLAIVVILLLYLQTLIFSEAPVTIRILSFINIWNLFIAFGIILPGYSMIEISKWLDSRKANEKST